MKRISSSPHIGTYTGMRKTGKYNMKPPKLGGGQGIKPPAVISKALGTMPGLPVHPMAVQQLMSHPDTNVVAAAKRLMKKY